MLTIPGPRISRRSWLQIGGLAPLIEGTLPILSAKDTAGISLVRVELRSVTRRHGRNSSVFRAFVDNTLKGLAHRKFNYVVVQAIFDTG
jgi:hypothetical protein